METKEQKPIGEITNYMELADILVNMPYESEESITLNDVLSRKEVIDRISEVAKTVPLYTESEDRRKEYIQKIEDQKDKTIEDHIKESYIDFLGKSVNAPTSMHLKGVVLLVVPVIKHFIDKYQTLKN